MNVAPRSRKTTGQHAWCIALGLLVFGLSMAPARSAAGTRTAYSRELEQTVQARSMSSKSAHQQLRYLSRARATSSARVRTAVTPMNGVMGMTSLF